MKETIIILSIIYVINLITIIIQYSTIKKQKILLIENLKGMESPNKNLQIKETIQPVFLRGVKTFLDKEVERIAGDSKDSYLELLRKEFYKEFFESIKPYIEEKVTPINGGRQLDLFLIINPRENGRNNEGIGNSKIG